MTTERARARILALGLAAAAAACTLSCSTRSPTDPDPPCTAIEIDERPDDVNVILIVNDTMRGDRVGVYGGPARTPSFDEFARENLYFARAFTNAPWTKPSIATLFTSTYPSQHALASHPELRENMAGDPSGTPLPSVDILGGGYTTLAEVLRDAGYRTAALVSNPWMVKGFGFEQGFDLYDDSFAQWQTDGIKLSRAGLEWLRKVEAGEKFFLYLHYIDSHRPYGVLTDEDVRKNADRLGRGAGPRSSEAREFFDWLVVHPQQSFSAATIERLALAGPSLLFVEMAYDRGIEDFDRALGLFLDGFARYPARDRTAVIVTSDHGEALFARGYGSHGLGLYDDELVVPFAAKLPGATVSEPRVDCAVELIDVMPTLCRYLGVSCPTPLYGRDFLGAGGERFAVSEGVMLKRKNRTIRNDTYKLLWEPDGPVSPREGEYALFNVRDDPGETRDLLSADHATPESRRIASLLEARIADAVPEFEAPPAEFAPVDPETEERLRALGYLD